MIETLDDIIEQLADAIGIFGAHDGGMCRLRLCRICWTARLKAQINEAAAVERKLNAHYMENA